MTPGQGCLIVALDVPHHKDAIALVQELDNVFFFKIGLELIVTGNMLDLITELQEKRSGQGGIFIDLKVNSDIGNTITKFVRACATHGIKFITLGDPVLSATTSKVIQTAVQARGASSCPKILGVPLLSNSHANELTTEELGKASNVTQYIVNRGNALINAGYDGLIVSGDAIKACREEFPDAIIVSPGIRPSGNSPDEHERFTTPREAIELGSNFLVVGRPIRNTSNRKDAAQKIIDEIDEALERRPSPVLT